MRKDYLSITLGAAVIVAVLAVVVALKVSVWSECRADHSWLYCWHLISS